MITISGEEIKAIMAEYEFNEDTIFEEDERVYKIKEALTHLEPADKIIWCLYMEFQSERKVAKILGCSRTPVNRTLKRIKSEILQMI